MTRLLASKIVCLPVNSCRKIFPVINQSTFPGKHQIIDSLFLRFFEIMKQAPRKGLKSSGGRIGYFVWRHGLGITTEYRGTAHRC